MYRIIGRLGLGLNKTHVEHTQNTESNFENLMDRQSHHNIKFLQITDRDSI